MKNNIFRSRALLFVTFIFFVSLPSGLFAEEQAAKEAASPEAKPAEEARQPAMAAKPIVPVKPLALSSDALKELEDRERLISEKEKELAERENAIQVQEKILQNKLKRIEEVSAKMASRLDKFKDESESKVVKLVAMLENMKPDAAAQYIENVDPFLAVEVLARINIQKAAKIWNKMDKKISARLSELYTGFRSKVEKEEASPANNVKAREPAQGKG